MIVEVNTALLALVGVVIAAALTAFGAILSVQARRIDELERRTLSAEAYNRRLWMWGRDMMDRYFRYRVDGAPDPLPLPSEDD